MYAVFQGEEQTYQSPPVHTFITCRFALAEARSGATRRKSISWEFHDEIGQTTTVLLMELTKLDLLRMDPGAVFAEHLREAKSLAEKLTLGA